MGTNGDQPLFGDYLAAAHVEDLTIYRPSTGTWYIRADAGVGGQGVVQWGGPGDVPVSGDWDGDGFNDIAIFRPSSGQWWIRNSKDTSTTVVGRGAIVGWGVPGDRPIGRRPGT